MPQLPRYSYTGPVDHTVVPDRSRMKGKSVIVTGGANGMGEKFVREFSQAGAFVTFGDLNKRDPSGEPTKPDVNIVQVNMNGTLFTWKLAVHYFRQQPDTPERDRWLIITGSMVAWIDSPGNWGYTVIKYELRGLMRTAGRSRWEQGIRINYVAPCWIRSAIRTAEYEKYLIDNGIEFGEQEDCARYMMRLACDTAINGHSLMIVPRTIKEGFMDADKDGYRNDAYFEKTREIQLRIIEDKWTDDYKVRVYK